MISPTLTNATVVTASTTSASSSRAAPRCSPVMAPDAPSARPSPSRITTWIIESVAPPTTLPMKIAVRDTGATSTSLRKSTFRSHTMYTPKKIDEKRTDWARMPG